MAGLGAVTLSADDVEALRGYLRRAARADQADDPEVAVSELRRLSGYLGAVLDEREQAPPGGRGGRTARMSG